MEHRAAQGNLPGQQMPPRLTSQAVSTAGGMPPPTTVGHPTMALHHPTSVEGPAGIPPQFAVRPRMPGPGSTQMLPPYNRQPSQPGTAPSDEEMFRATPLTSARDPMISENNLKAPAGESMDVGQSEAEPLHLSDIELKGPKQSMSSEDEKHEDDDLLSM